MWFYNCGTCSFLNDLAHDGECYIMIPDKLPDSAQALNIVPVGKLFFEQFFLNGPGTVHKFCDRRVPMNIKIKLNPNI
jgi:hypothetical protein